MLKIGIVDDEENPRKVIRVYLERYLNEPFEIIFEAVSFQDTIDFTRLFKPDILFLDINIIGGTGVEVAQNLINYSKTKIIFTTAYNEYVIQALRLKVFDYLLKPIDTDSFIDCLNRIETEFDIEKRKVVLDSTLDSKISISTNLGVELIPTNNILYIEADASYCKLYLIDNKYLVVSRPLKYIENKLVNKKIFLKIHRSYIVNTDYVVSLDRVQNMVNLNTGQKLKISRNNLKEVFHFFKLNKN